MSAQARLLLMFPILAVGLMGCRHLEPDAYPIGLYGAPASALTEIHRAGFNLVQATATAEYLNAAKDANLAVLASPGTSAGFHFSAPVARRAVREFDHHPALWAWYLVDEPDLNSVPPVLVEQAHRFFKRIGATKPTALVIQNGYEADHYASLTDVTMIDRYPVPWAPLATFEQHVRLTRHAVARPHQRFLAVIQAFDWGLFPELLPVPGDRRPPTYEEIRCMTYCALVQGADGLFYYAFDDGRWRMAEHPDTWEALCRVVGEVRAREPLFRAKRLWWAWRNSVRYVDSALRNEVDESSVVFRLLRVSRDTSALSAGDYVLAVNTTGQPHDLRLYLPYPTSVEVAVHGEQRSLLPEQNWVRDQFAPYAVHVYGPLLPRAQ